MFATIVGALATFALAVLYALLRYFWSSINYGAFLCHHKAGAGVWARYFKLRLACYTKANIFIDSDNLMELDTLFECVRASTRHLVVLGTRDVCYRMWMIGRACQRTCWTPWTPFGRKRTYTCSTPSASTCRAYARRTDISETKHLRFALPGWQA
mmetsp:Transcript_63440/g.182078  ORF Transcript_63440/g.182078 Transcript_63440/m.182078 type:complete len:155 (-) Transcript_63440:918-1382(-)